MGSVAGGIQARQAEEADLRSGAGMRAGVVSGGDIRRRSSNRGAVLRHAPAEAGGPFTPELRAQTERLCARMHYFYDRRETPPPVYTKGCESCSLKNICLPAHWLHHATCGLIWRKPCVSDRMRQFLNSLYVTTQGAWLACDGQSVDVRVEKESKLRVPIQTLSSIVCFGQVSCSPFLLGLCAEHGVKVAFLTEHGRFLARVEGPVSATYCCGGVSTGRLICRKRLVGDVLSSTGKDGELPERVAARGTR